jgi:hypothetical protein
VVGLKMEMRKISYLLLIGSNKIQVHPLQSLSSTRQRRSKLLRIKSKKISFINTELSQLMIEEVCYVLFTVFNADLGIAMGRGITMMYYFGCIMMSFYAIAFFFLGLNHCYVLFTRSRTSQSL